MKEKLLSFLHTLTPYDYMFYGGVFLLFFLLIILTLFLRKRIILALLLLLLAIIDILVGPTIGVKLFHNYLYKNSVTLQKVKRLQFVDAVVIEGTLKNDSRFDFKECKLEATIYKDTHNKYKNIILRLKPIKKASKIIKDIPKNADVPFRFLVEPFKYKKDFNVSIEGMCK